MSRNMIHLGQVPGTDTEGKGLCRAPPGTRNGEIPSGQCNFQGIYMEDESFDCFSRQVVIGSKDDFKEGTVDLPPEYYEFTGIRPGHHVVIQYGDKHLKVKAKADDLLKRNEVRVGPKMAEKMGLVNGTVICVEDKVTFTERIFDEVEEIREAAGERFEHAKDRVFVEGAEIRAQRREKTLDRIIPSRTEEPPPRAIEVEPDLSHIGEGPPEEPVSDISEQVKVWNPDPEGDGVKEYRPGDDSEDEED